METLQNLIIKYFNADENTSATIIITISIFFIGVLFQFGSSQVKKYFIKRVRRNTFKEIVRNLSIVIKKQAENYSKTSKSFSIETLGNFYLTKNVLGHIDSFNQFDYNQVYESFLYRINCKPQNTRKLISKIYEHVKVSNVIDVKFDKDIDTFLEKINSYEHHWFENTETARKIIVELSDYVSQKGTKYFQADYIRYIKSMTQLFADWKLFENRTDIFICYTNLIKPLLDINKAKTDCNRNLIDSLLAAENDYENIVRLLDLYSRHFNNYSFSYKCSAKILELSINKI